MILLLLCSLGGFLVLIYGLRLARWLRRKKSAHASSMRCVCGYPMENLDTARCPECGRVFGFNATAEELGLTTEQLQRAAARRRERQSGGG